MDKVYQGHRFANIEVFEEFLKKNAKIYNPICLDIFLDELLEQYFSSGFTDYELKSFETFSHHPECIYFGVIQPFYEEGEINIPPAIIVF